MKKLALTLAIGAATLLGASAVNAAPAQKQTQAPTAHSDTATMGTDMSSHRRHRWHRHRHHHHWGYHRPYRSYGYYRPYRSYGYYPSYYRPAPVISFGFGFGGGPRWGHRHHHHW
jgi:hypothetical protein